MKLHKLLGEIFKKNSILKININNKSCKFIAEDENYESATIFSVSKNFNDAFPSFIF